MTDTNNLKPPSSTTTAYSPQDSAATGDAAWSGSISTSGLAKPEHAIGVINLATLKVIQETLSKSSAHNDIDLAAWIQKSYFVELLRPREEGRRIYTKDDFNRLFRTYQRTKTLSNNAKPEKWPFYTERWKVISPATLKRNAPASDREKGAKEIHKPHTSIITEGSDSENLTPSKSVDTMDRVAVEDGADAAPDVGTPTNASAVLTQNELGLAVHSDPVRSNLDAYPPTSNPMKRKSETLVETNQRPKRTPPVRGKRGPGRPRASIGRFSSANASKQAANEDEDKEHELLTRSDSNFATPPTTRAAALRKAPAPQVPASLPVSDRALRSTAHRASLDIMDQSGKDSPLQKEVKVPNKTGAKTLGGAASKVGAKSKKETLFLGIAPDNSQDDLVRGALARLHNQPSEIEQRAGLLANSYTGLAARPPPVGPISENPPAMANSRSKKAQQAQTEKQAQTQKQTQADKQAQVDTAPTPKTPKPAAPSGSSNSKPQVEFFARLQTPAGPTDIAISPSSFTGDVDMILRYAQWKQEEEEGMDLSFEQFVRVFGFAKKT